MDLEHEEELERDYEINDPLETRVGHLHDLLNEKLAEAFHSQTWQVILHDIAKIASEYDPIDLAHAAMRLPAHARPVLYENLPDFNAKVIFMINTGSNTRSAIFRTINDKEIAQLIESMPSDEAVWVLDDLSNRRLKRVFDMLDPKKASELGELQKHDRDSAARLMSNEYFAFPMDVTIGQVARHIRNNPGIALSKRIFVLNEVGELLGYVPDRNLIINPSHLPLRRVMRPVNHKVHPDDDRDEVVDLVERYDIPALPVVDDDNRLVGVIAYEDVVEAMKDIADETIASIAGTAEVVSEHDPIFKRFLWRTPWLLVTLFAGLITATGISYFRYEPWYVYLSVFVPLITGMSGNVGIQCSTILVRGIASGELTLGGRREAVINEVMIGLMIGFSFGILCGLSVFFLDVFSLHSPDQGPLIVGIIVGVGLFGACLTASSLGTFSPFFFVKLGIDPAVSSGPIVTAFNDIISTLMFFIIAMGMTHVFLK
ncbi:MAG: magnesium transporter [Chlamydiales bacterium]